jgi:hypothetical protein
MTFSNPKLWLGPKNQMKRMIKKIQHFYFGLEMQFLPEFFFSFVLNAEFPLKSQKKINQSFLFNFKFSINFKLTDNAVI